MAHIEDNNDTAWFSSLSVQPTKYEFQLRLCHLGNTQPIMHTGEQISHFMIGKEVGLFYLNKIIK